MIQNPKVITDQKALRAVEANNKQQAAGSSVFVPPPFPADTSRSARGRAVGQRASDAPFQVGRAAKGNGRQAEDATGTLPDVRCDGQRNQNLEVLDRGAQCDKKLAVPSSHSRTHCQSFARISLCKMAGRVVTFRQERAKKEQHLKRNKAKCRILCFAADTCTGENKAPSNTSKDTCEASESRKAERRIRLSPAKPERWSRRNGARPVTRGPLLRNWAGEKHRACSASQCRADSS